MIKELKESFSYTNYDIAAKLNEVIRCVNELDAKEPIIEVVKWDDLIAWFNNNDVELPIGLHIFMARRIK